MKKETAIKGLCASGLMSKPVEKVRMNDSLRDVALLFDSKNMSAAIVVDRETKPVGVITKTDLARSQKGKDEIYTVEKRAEKNRPNEYMPAGFHPVEEDTVEHWMTPVIFSVKPEASITVIAQQMVKYGVHHVFVRETEKEPIVGVVSSFDILREVAASRPNGSP